MRRARPLKDAASASLLVLAASAFCPRAQADAGQDRIDEALAARDARGDLAAARAKLLPLLEGRAGDARARDLAARAAFLLGELDERERKFDDAVARYREVLAIDPGNYYAGTAFARAEALAGQKASFAELARLDEVRKDPTKQADPRALDALVAETEGWRAQPAIRAEALLFAATSYLERVRDPVRAGAIALGLARDASADATARARAYELYYAAASTRGDLDGLRANVLENPDAPRSLRAVARRDFRRRALHRASLGALVAGSLGLLTAGAITLRRRRLARALDVLLDRRALAFLAAAVLGGAAIAEAWTRETGRYFFAFGAGLLGAHLLASAWRGAFGDRARAVRLVGGATAAACVLAAAYLALERGESHGAGLLAGFGL